MKLAAKLSIGVVVLLAILVGAALYLLGSLDGIVKAAIEEHGSRVTQTKVGVSGVKIELTKGAGSISGITVANPSGFTQPKAFKLGNISTAIDTATVTEDPVVIKEIMVKGPEIYYEINKDGTANFDVIQANVKKSTGGATKDESKGKEVKLIINRLVIEGGKVSATIAALGDKPLEASMPRIVMTDIGKKEGGATGAEVAKQVADVVISKTKSSVTALGVDKYLGVGADVIKKQLEAVGGDPSKLLEGGATEGIGDKLKDVAPTDTMKKLFQ
jgi:hypothetical protein